MKIDLNQAYVNADDSPAIDAVTNKPLTLRQVLIGTLLDPRGPEGEKVQRYNLFRDIKKSTGTITLAAEDIAFLKKAVLEVQPVLVVGQTHEMLETPAVEPPVKASKSLMAPKRDPDDYLDVK